MSDNKIIITGSGKCGTSFLVHLLTELGLDTGYSVDYAREVMATRNGGLEWNIRGEHARAKEMPTIIKNPKLCFDLLDRAKKFSWDIKHVYILVRNWDDIADHLYERNDEYRGVPFDQDHYEHLKRYRASYIGHLFYQIAKEDIPHTVLLFPRVVEDPEYLYEKLGTLTNGIDYNLFEQKFKEVANPKRVHYYSELDKE